MGIRMKEMKRIVVSLGLCAVMAVVPAGAVNAQDVNEDGAEIDIQELAEYDLEKGGTQSFEIVDEDGEETEIVVEEVPGKVRVANGTYRITGKKKYAWTAGFCVKISGNRFTKVYGSFYKTTRGGIQNARLVKNSDAQATLSFIHSYDNFKGKVGVKAKIINKKLLMSIF